MRVGVDLDGVVDQFNDALRHWLSTYRGYDADRLVKVTRWELFEDWGMTLDEFIEECNNGVEAGVICAWGEPYPGSREALQRIVDGGHSLHVVTARGFGSPGVSERLTVEWVRANLPPVRSITFSSDKTIARVDMMIEDNLSNYDALTDAGVSAYLIDRPWNAVPGDTRFRVRSMDEFADQVLLVAERELTNV